jgi:predicted Zn-ribbon and HTH transcriptional regulator
MDEKSFKDIIAKKDALIQELQARVKEANEAELPDMAPYSCNKCGRAVHFNYVMAPIRLSGMCPSCFHE